MYLEMFANELSLTPQAPDMSIGQDRARQFVMTIIAATAVGVRRVLRLSEDFLGTPFAPGYDWRNWASDKRVDRDLRRYFQSLATKVPFFPDEPDAEAASEDLDCYWQAKQARGFRAAYIADGLALSMPSQQEWDRGLIECEIHEIVDEDISCRTEDIHHASSPAHVDQHMGWFEQRIQHTVESGGELWRRIGDFFPALVCCSAIEQQMAELPSQSLASITRGLFRLNAYCVEWQGGTFSPEAIGCTVSPESQGTLDMYGGERTFLCPDGQQRVFSWHAKVGRWRIYFDPAPGPGRLLLGYVGKHLRTAKFR